MIFVAEGLSGKVITTVVDVRDKTAVENWVNSCVQKEGRLDGSANCAGVNGGTKASNIQDTVFPTT